MASINLQDLSSRNNNSRKPTFNLHVLAATIVFTAFEHLDHWPVPLVKAYAEDCFGPRLWVDHKQCVLLVENLALAHGTTSNGETDQSDTLQLAADAATVAETYRTFDVFAQDCAVASSSPLQSRRRDSVAAADAASPKRTFRSQLSSVSSGSLDSGTKKGGVQQKRQRKDNPQQGMESDSGDEEENLVKQSLSDLSKPYSKKDDGSGPSSGEENVDIDLARKRKRRGGNDAPSSTGDVEETASQDATKDGAGMSNGSVPSETATSEDLARGESNRYGSMGNTETLYPIVQRRLLLERVRRRFFGVNLKSAHDAISASFSDRLDVKSKQNSSLLHCLPSFTTIPGVRGLIAVNLEKWLQSPALAGLARALFSSTVNQMKNIDPPLPEDLQAIDSIIGMRLKANQVRSDWLAASIVHLYFLMYVRLFPENLYS
jgi:hypothetical protein